jgi:mannose/fructose/sorbose-specific phosphotransferase system IIA component
VFPLGDVSKMTNTLVQIVVASHGELARALVNTAELIAGQQADIRYYSLMPGDDVRGFQNSLAEVVAQARPTLILVDMAGGTPWNIALQVAAQHEAVRIVSGVNLPMLLEITFSRQGMTIDQLATLALQTGAQAVQAAPRGN